MPLPSDLKDLYRSYQQEIHANSYNADVNTIPLTSAMQLIDKRYIYYYHYYLNIINSHRWMVLNICTVTFHRQFNILAWDLLLPHCVFIRSDMFIVIISNNFRIFYSYNCLFKEQNSNGWAPGE